MTDSSDSAHVEVLISLREEGLEMAAFIREQLSRLNDTAKDLNATLERMADRAHADALAMLQLAGATTVATGAAVAFHAAASGWAAWAVPLIIAIAALLVVFAPFVVLLTAASVLVGTFAVLGAGVAYLASRTPEGAAAIKGFVGHLTAMADVLSKAAVPMLLEMIKWADKLLPSIQAAGSSLLTWFGQRLPALLPIMTDIFGVTAKAILFIGTVTGNVVDFFLQNWPKFSKAAGDALALIKNGWNAVAPLMLADLRGLSVLFRDVVNHLGDLKPELVVVGVLMAGMVLIAEALAGAVLLVVRAVEFLIADLKWLIQHKTDLGNLLGNLVGAGGGVGGGTGPNFPKSNLGPNSAGGPPPATPGLIGPPAPRGSVNTGGVTIQPIVYVSPSPMLQRMIDLDLRDRLRRLNLAQA